MRRTARLGGRLLVAVLALALAWEAGVEIVDGIASFPSYPSFRFYWPVLEPTMTSVAGLLGEAAVAGACLVALLLLWKLPGDPGTRTLALLLTLGVAYTSPAWQQVVMRRLPSLYSSPHFYDIIRPLPGWLALAAFLRFSSVFPASLEPESLPPSTDGGGIRARVRGFRRWLLRPPAPWLLAAALWTIPFITYLLAPELHQGGSSYLEEYGLAGALVFLLAGVANLQTGFRRVSETERRKILWLVAGMTAAAAIVLVPSAVLFLDQVAGYLGVDLVSLRPRAGLEVFLFLRAVLFVLAAVILIVSLLFAVFYRGALSPELVIRKSALYGLLSTGLLVAFSGAESAISAVLQDRLPYAGTLSPSISGVLIALVFKPTERFLKRKIEAALPGAIGAEEGGEEVPRPEDEEETSTV